MTDIQPISDEDLAALRSAAQRSLPRKITEVYGGSVWHGEATMWSPAFTKGATPAVFLALDARLTAAEARAEVAIRERDEARNDLADMARMPGGFHEFYRKIVAERDAALAKLAEAERERDELRLAGKIVDRAWQQAEARVVTEATAWNLIQAADALLGAGQRAYVDAGGDLNEESPEMEAVLEAHADLCAQIRAIAASKEST